MKNLRKVLGTKKHGKNLHVFSNWNTGKMWCFGAGYFQSAYENLIGKRSEFHRKSKLGKKFRKTDYPSFQNLNSLVRIYARKQI